MQVLVPSPGGAAAPSSYRQPKQFEKQWILEIQYIGEWLRHFAITSKAGFDSHVGLSWADQSKNRPSSRREAIQIPHPSDLSCAVLFLPKIYPSTGKMWELAGYSRLCFHSAAGCCDGCNCDTLRMFAAFCRSHTHTSAQLVWCACVITVQHVVTKSCWECWFKWFLSKHCPLFRSLHLAVSRGWTLCYSQPDSLLWHWKSISSVSQHPWLSVWYTMPSSTRLWKGRIWWVPPFYR